jgi:hypothetical protein
MPTGNDRKMVLTVYSNDIHAHTLEGTCDLEGLEGRCQSGYTVVSSTPELVSVDGIYPFRGLTPLNANSYLDNSLEFALSMGYDVSVTDGSGLRENFIPFAILGRAISYKKNGLTLPNHCYVCIRE